MPSQKAEINNSILRNLISQAPVAMAVVVGPDFTVELVNKKQLEIWQKTTAEVLHQPLFAIFPELKSHEFKGLLTQVYTTGIPFAGKEVPAQLLRNGALETAYYDFTYEPVFNEFGGVDAISVVSADVSNNVVARNKAAESTLITGVADRLKLYEKVVTNIKEAVMITEAAPFELPGPRILYVNDALCKMTGYTAAEVIGKTPRMFQGPKTDRKQLDRLRAALEKREFVQVQLINYRKDGTEFLVEFDIVPVADEMGEIKHMVSVQRDITEQSKAKEKLQRSERFNRSVLESSPDCLKILDTEGRIRYMNLNGLHQMEIDDFSTVENKSWTILLGSENEALLQASVNKALRGETAHFTAQCPTAKGNVKWWDVMVAPVGQPGEAVQQLISVSRDLTEQKKLDAALRTSEAMFKSIFDNSLAPILVADDKGNYSAANKAAGALFGYSVDELLQMNVGDLKTTAKPGAAGRYEAYLTKGEETGEFDFVTSHGTQKFAQYHAIRIKSDFNLSILMDVTEQKQAHEKIRQSEARFRWFTQNSPDMIVQMDKDLRYTYVSPLMEKFSGIQPAMFIGKTPGEVGFPEEFSAFISAQMALVVAKKELHEVEYLGLKGENILTRVVPELDENGDIVAFLIITTDITERKKNEELLRRSKELLQAGLNVANLALAEFDYASGLVTLSTAAAIMYGLSPTDLTVTRAQVHHTFHPECKKEMELLIEQCLNPAGNGLIAIEHRILLPNGKTRWLKVNKQVYFDEERTKPVYSILAAQDITANKEAEEIIRESENQFRGFANSIQNLAWIANSQGWIYWFNQRWYEYTGSTPEAMEGWGWQKVHPDHLKRVVDFVKDAWIKEEAFELTFPLCRYDGEYRWFLTRAYPVKNVSGSIERWIGTNTDITEQKSFAEELERKVSERTEELFEKNLELERSNAELSSFSYVASHDLSEPLRKIQIFIGRIIEQEKFADKTQDYFNRIISSAERMKNLIDSLHDFSHANTTLKSLEPCDLNKIIEESKHDFYETIIEKKASIQFENLPTIKGVSVQLSQVFTNLIGNALKYSRLNVPPQVKITCERLEGNAIEHPLSNKHESYCAITIADNGIGFEKQYETKIFELFQRLHGKQEYSGTGIGLAIVKKIVTNHRGFITAKGEPGVGATFILYLPAT